MIITLDYWSKKYPPEKLWYQYSVELKEWISAFSQRVKFIVGSNFLTGGKIMSLKIPSSSSTAATPTEKCQKIGWKKSSLRREMKIPLWNWKAESPGFEKWSYKTDTKIKWQSLQDDIFQCKKKSTAWTTFKDRQIST